MTNVSIIFQEAYEFFFFYPFKAVPPSIRTVAQIYIWVLLLSIRYCFQSLRSTVVFRFLFSHNLHRILLLPSFRFLHAGFLLLMCRAIISESFLIHLQQPMIFWKAKITKGRPSPVPGRTTAQEGRGLLGDYAEMRKVRARIAIAARTTTRNALAMSAAAPLPLEAGAV